MSTIDFDLRAWLLLRITGLASLLYLLGFFIFLMVSPWQSYTDWQQAVTHPLGRSGFLLIFTTVLVHAWLAMRKLLLEQVRRLFWRLPLLTLGSGWLMLCELWLLLIMLDLPKPI